METSVTKCLIVGAAGVGKTHLKHLLLKKDPPEQRVSTGLADNPVRAISLTLAGVGGQEEDDWFVVEDDQALMSFVGQTVHGGVPMATSLDAVVSTFPKMTINNVPSDRASVGHPDPMLANITKDTTTQQSRTVAIENELIHHINHSSGKGCLSQLTMFTSVPSPYVERRRLFGVKLIQFIDSGGQLQYHSILPLFIKNPAVIVLVLNVSEDLSHHPITEYYGADGKPVGIPHQSSLSHKQILQHCLQTKQPQDVCPRIVSVGTHSDVASKESINEKNRQLKELLNTGGYRVVYKGETLEEVIFAVNCKSPQDQDKLVAKALRQKIMYVSPESIKMPIAWFGLEVFLQRSTEDGVLSLVQCQVIARRLHLEGDAFLAALHHLVHHNVFLYYPEVLPQTVFCDPQVVLTKVTELVQYQHKLRDNPDKNVAADDDLFMFRDRGLVSVELLRKFPKHYKEGLFSPQDLLALLVSVRAIAMIRDGEYLIPALLPHMECDEVSQNLPQSTSLIIRPTQGCIPSGLFCCLVAHLLSLANPFSWKVCMERNRPLCLYRNCISFERNGTTDIVTIVDTLTYIGVHVSEACTEVCREIRDCVHSGIKSACNVLKYGDIQFENAFICAGPSCTSDPLHVATVVCSRSSREYKWKCTVRGRQNGDLSESQLMWLDGTVAIIRDPSCTSGRCYLFVGIHNCAVDVSLEMNHVMEVNIWFETIAACISLTFSHSHSHFVPFLPSSTSATCTDPTATPQYTLCTNTSFSPDYCSTRYDEAIIFWSVLPCLFTIFLHPPQVHLPSLCCWLSLLMVPPSTSLRR